MSYEQMEAILVHRIAEVRESEDLVARAFEEGSNNVTADYARLNAQVRQIERLLAAMDSASVQTIPERVRWA